MEQRPKRMGGAEVIDFASRKIERHKEGVLEGARAMISGLQDDILNSASEAPEYGDRLTRAAHTALKAAYDKCVNETTEPGTPAFDGLEQTLAVIQKQKDTLKRTREMFALLDDEIRNADSEENKRAGEWAVGLLNEPYRKIEMEGGGFNLEAFRTLEETLDYVHNILFPPSGDPPPNTVAQFKLKQPKKSA